MRRFTESGRVVYDRPKHIFSSADIARIAAKVDVGKVRVKRDKWFTFLEALVKFLFSEEDSLLGYGGGEFGSFEIQSVGAPIPGVRMIIIMEEE